MFYIFGDAMAEINKTYGLNQATGYPNENYMVNLLINYGVYNRKINGSILSAYTNDYSITSDLTYKTDTDYFTANDTTLTAYTLLVEGTDYEIGDTISGDIYVLTRTLVSKNIFEFKRNFYW